MAGAPLAGERCGIDTVAIARVARMLAANDAASLARLFSPRELADAGEGPGRAASLAARFAAKEACLKLFPRETALETIAAADFAVERDAYGAPQVVPGAAAEVVMGRYRIARIALSMSHDETNATAVAVAERAVTEAPAIGRLVYRCLPFRRPVVLENLRRVYGGRIDDAEIVRLAQAHYAHLARLVAEFLRFRWLSDENPVERATKRGPVIADDAHNHLDAGIQRRGAFQRLKLAFERASNRSGRNRVADELKVQGVEVRRCGAV